MPELSTFFKDNAILLLILVYVPGAAARTAANTLIPETKTPSGWGEQMIAVVVSVVFWTVFCAPRLFVDNWITEAETKPYRTGGGLVGALVLTTLAVLLYRYFVPPILDSLGEIFPHQRVPGGERSPWLLGLNAATGENRVVVWTKSGVVYKGELRFSPDRDDEEAIVLTVRKKARVMKDAAHYIENSDEWEAVPETPLMVILPKSEIAAIEILDLRAACREERMAEKRERLEEKERLAKQRRDAKAKHWAEREPLKESELVRLTLYLRSRLKEIDQAPAGGGQPNHK